jgi:glycosyltransferase involved in cell wall biosynthesis
VKAPNSQELNILYVSYPLLPVTGGSGGGAEQMLWLLEREMRRRSHKTTVAACDGSRVSGDLAITSPGAVGNDGFEQCSAEHIANVCALITARQERGKAFDLVHDESGSFWMHAGEISTPVLATLHLPRDFYPSQAWWQVAPNVHLNCVSWAQARTFEGVAGIAAVIPNGIDLERYRFHKKKGDYILWLGRLCHEKGAHVALDVAHQAGMKLVIAGTVYPFSYHHQYCRREIAPRMQRANGKAIFIESPRLRRKIELLQQAHAVLIPSLADETSSLVAMEAMACGTPVIALRRGALPEVVADGVTGFVVDSTENLIDAVYRVGEIHPQDCRARAENCFQGARMCEQYEQLYKKVLIGKLRHVA